MTGTRQYCKSNGTWSTPTAWRAFVPVKNDVKFDLYRTRPTHTARASRPETRPAEALNLKPRTEIP